MIIKQYEYLYKVLVLAEEASPDHDNQIAVVPLLALH